MITSQLLAKIFPGTKRALRDRFIEPMNRIMPLYGIKTKARVSAFLATGGIETDYLRTTTEYADGSDYEGRRDLGNTQKGDGVKFKGHGFFQTTGRYNHRQVTRATFDRLGIDFEVTPKRLCEIDIAVESACIFWRDNKLEAYADRGDFFGFSGVVNTGNPKKQANHWRDRKALYEKCLVLIPNGFTIAPEPAAPSPMVEPITPEPAAPAVSEPVALTPTTNDDFLTSAIDKTVSADEIRTGVKGALPSLGTRFWRYLARPMIWLYALLEAGNAAAWLGVVVAVGILIYVLYRNRAKIFAFWEKLKTKITS